MLRAFGLRWLGTMGLVTIATITGCGSDGPSGEQAGVRRNGGPGASELPGLAEPGRVVPPNERPPGRTTFCHATGSATHPYETITTADPAVVRAHSQHQDRRDIIPAPEGGCPGPQMDGGPMPDMPAPDAPPPTDAGPDAPPVDVAMPDQPPGSVDEGDCSPCRQTCTECEQKCDACTAGDAACLDKCRRCRLDCDICACDCNGCEFQCEVCRNTCYQCATDDYNCWSSCQSCRSSCMACRFPSADCQPQSCEDQGKNCGTINDGCGRSQHCGDCLEGETCGTEAMPNVCQRNLTCFDGICL